MEEKILIGFGLHIKKLRHSLNLSQEQFAGKSGLDRTYISGIERGKRNVSLVNLVKLAAALNINKKEILDFSLED